MASVRSGKRQTPRLVSRRLKYSAGLSMTLVFVFRGFGILCNQGDQGVLLAVGELAEALK